MTLKVLPTSCYCYNSEEQKHKIPESKNEAKQNCYEIPCAKSLIKCLENI